MKVAPSLLAADPACLGDALSLIEAAGADMVHIDVMDGHFAPNIAFGPAIVARLRKLSTLTFDVHLMLEHPESYIPRYVDAGADSLTVHIEVGRHPLRTIELIRTHNKGVGIALNPATSVSALDHVVDLVDMVLVMSVNPGYSYQSFLPLAVDKVRAIRLMIANRGLSADIAVDGGIEAQTTAAQVVAAGASVLVAGSGVFGQPDPAVAIRALQSLRH